MFEISLQIDPQFQSDIKPEQLRDAAEKTLTHCGSETGALSINVTTAEAVRALNREFRGVDAPTDVLSFGTAADDDFLLLLLRRLLGGKRRQWGILPPMK